MIRRDLLKIGASALGMVYLSLLPEENAFATGADATQTTCFKPWSKNTKIFSWSTKKPPYKIALSNSYIGNEWRTEMLQIAKAYTERQDVKKYLRKFSISSSGNDVSAQIAQVNQMILEGVDAIVIDAATPSGLNSVIDKAARAGVLVVSFDNVVTTDKAVTINQSQFEMGKRWAQFIVKHNKGKGHVLMIRGVAGTYVDEMLTKGGLSVFKKYPNIKTTQVYGKWDDGVAQKQAADAIASAGYKFDGIWCQGGTTGAVRAFLDAGYKQIPVVSGEAENGVRKLAAKLQFPMLSIGQSPTLVAVSIDAAIKILQGHKLPREIRTPIPFVTTKDLKAGVNYFPKQPDSFFTAINIKQCGLTFDVKHVLSQKV